MAARTWLAVALSCLVWFGYLKWFAPVPPAANGARSSKAVPLERSAAPIQPNSSPVSEDIAEVSSPRTPGRIVTLQTRYFGVEFSSASGDVYRVSLNNFTQGLTSNSPKVQVVNPTLNPVSLNIQFTDPKLQQAVLGGFDSRNDMDSVVFERQVGGVSVVKQYRFTGDYMLDAKTTLRLPPGKNSDWGYAIVPVGGSGLQSDHNQPLLTWEAVYSQNKKVERIALEKIASQSLHQGITDWLAFGNRYFIASVLNRSALNPDILMLSNERFTGGYLRYPVLRPESGEYQLSMRFYLGPKDLRFLNQEPQLTALVDHGFFSFFAKPILFLLNFFYGFVHNYGVAIILLTILVRALFYPLSLKSYKSMRSMQKLQPQLQQLKEKHKDNRERFNQEQLALFKAHGVNPAGGCLPMLVQLPVFIALYAVLQNSIELFHAPFFGWIKDLSSKDPYYIFPVLMGAAMFLQQKMTPTPGMDPMQQKMMLIMPVVFTFMMFNLPSGLTIYIFLSTLLGILQQWAMNREKHKEAQVSTATI